MTNRVGWRDYFLGIADAVAVRADCTRRQVGAVVVDPSTRHIIAAGYNGAPPGQPGCLSDSACPRGRHYRALHKGAGPADGVINLFGNVCGGCGLPWPCAVSVPAGSSYDTGAGACIALHAEQNATIRAGDRARGAWIYLTDEPCDACWRLLKGAGYSHVIWPGGEWTSGVPENSLMLWTLLQALDRNVRRLLFRKKKRTCS